MWLQIYDFLYCLNSDTEYYLNNGIRFVWRGERIGGLGAAVAGLSGNVDIQDVAVVDVAMPMVLGSGARFRCRSAFGSSQY